MGGGVGISQPARFRVATENTKFAMPETGIGLFPDVGGGWYLSRLEGRMGQYLALTGSRVAGPECLALGLATHYLPSSALVEAKAQIASEDVEHLDGILSTLSETPPASKIVETLLQIMKELAALRTKSPQTCKVALRQLAESLKLTDFVDNMAMEYRIASRVLVRPDFAEGVRAVIVDKDNAPQWDPATAEGVTEALVDAIFAPLPVQEEWKPL
jgi:enoyl-CoA hydratase